MIFSCTALLKQQKKLNVSDYETFIISSSYYRRLLIGNNFVKQNFHPTKPNTTSELYGKIGF